VILADVIEEARRLIAAAEERRLILRALGGVAIRLHCPSAAAGVLARPCRDIDLAVSVADARQLDRWLMAQGYAQNRRFNYLWGQTRRVFYDLEHARQLDIFVGDFELCHRLPIGDRLTVDPLTLPLAELLLTKLQMIELSPNDLLDVYALVLDHPVGDVDAETINRARIAELCGADWGLYHTVSRNIDRALGELKGSALPATAQATIGQRLIDLGATIERAPKSLKWRLRARLGERARWYDEVE
jgi:hypothetical protein